MNILKKYYLAKFREDKINFFIEPKILELLKKSSDLFFSYEKSSSTLFESSSEWSITYHDNGTLEIENQKKYKKIELENEVEDDIKYYFCENSKEIIILKEFMDDEWISRSIMRLIRNIFKLLAMERGEIFPHGGLISLNGVGIALIGDKRSGKTTTILNCLKNGADFITNDDVSFSFQNGGLVGQGWPRGIAIRGDSVKMVFNIRNLSEFYEKLSHPGNKLIQTSTFLGEEPNGLIFFQPKELADIFGVNVLPSIDLNIVVFTNFTQNKLEKPKLSILSQEEGINKLFGYLQDNPGKYNEFLLSSFKRSDVSQVFSKYHEVLKKIKMYNLTTGFYKSPDVPELLSNLRS